jgi:hypothetical protein
MDAAYGYDSKLDSNSPNFRGVNPRGGQARDSRDIPGTQYGGLKVKNPDPPGFKDPGDAKPTHGVGGGVLSFQKDLKRRAAAARAKKGGA